MNFLYNVSDDLLVLDDKEFRVIATKMNSKTGFIEIDVHADDLLENKLSDYESFEDVIVDSHSFGAKDAKIIRVSRGERSGVEVISIRLKIIKPVELTAI